MTFLLAHNRKPTLMPDLRSQLCQALEQDNLEALGVLLNSSPDTTSSNLNQIICQEDTGKYAIHLAQSRGSIELLRLHEACIHTRALATGNTPLHTSLNTEVTKALLDAGACPKMKNTDGSTPLFYARSASMTRALLNAGANVSHRNEYGHSALDLACSWTRIDVIRVLLHHSSENLVESEFQSQLKQLNSRVDQMMGSRLRLEQKDIVRLKIIQTLVCQWQQLYLEEEEDTQTLKRLVLRKPQVDEICAWLPFQRLCRNPVDALLDSTSVPHEIIQLIVQDYIGLWHRFPCEDVVVQTRKNELVPNVWTRVWNLVLKINR